MFENSGLRRILGTEEEEAAGSYKIIYIMVSYVAFTLHQRLVA
jgi:hypothetical protein